MRNWIDLYDSHRQARNLGDGSWTSELRRRLIALADAGHCDPNICGRFTYSAVGNLMEWSIRSGGNSRPLPLCNMQSLAVADLTVMALATRDNHLHQLTIMVDGMRADESHWALAVHLPDDRETAQNPAGDRQGLGAGGHAALHCHIGPDLDTVPKVRVPLPSLRPADLLDWVVSQIIPTAAFEPAPWASVVAELPEANA